MTRKLVRTKKELKELERKYGKRTAEVVYAVENGKKTLLDTLRVKYGKRVVATILGNHTRGMYFRHVDYSKYNTPFAF